MLIFSQQKYPNSFLGKSKFTVARYGCLSTDIDMIYDFIYGRTMTPDTMAMKLNFNDNGEILWDSLAEVDLKLTYRVRYFDKVGVDAAFKDPNKFVILQVNNNHWLWLIGRYWPVIGYKIVDPWFGDKSYTSRYKNNITGYAVIEKL